MLIGGSIGVLIVYLLLLCVVLPDNAVTLIRQLSTGLHAIGDIKWAFGLDGPMMVVDLVCCRLLHYVLAGVLCVCILFLCPADKCVLTKWGRNSLQVYIAHLLLLYAVKGLCSIDQIAASFGLSGDLWCVLFPIIGAIPLTAILAASGRPNEWVAKTKDWVSCHVLNPQ